MRSGQAARPPAAVLAAVLVLSALLPPAPAAAACQGSVGPGIPPPATVPSGIPGFHAHWYGQSGYPTLCPGERSTATVAFYNSGTAGWHRGVMGHAAYLGTWGPEPGQDRPSPLGGRHTGWPAPDRLADQPHDWVGPNQVAWFQFTIEAPQQPGHYRLYLRPLIEGATWMEDFGVYWSVTVLDPDGTPPPPPPIGCTGECWPLTGIPHEGGPIGRRGLSVRIDNAVPARPHYGISQADMVFELLVEGQITRLAAIFHSQDPAVIGSIRSARLSDRSLTPMVRGGLAYSGATNEETEAIRADATTGAYFDLNANYVSAGYYRVATRPNPFNMFTSSAALREALNRLGGGGAVEIPRWDFLRAVGHEPAAGGFDASAPATALEIPYRSGARVRYEYQTATRTYARWQDSGRAMVREIDAANGAAVAARNVVVIHTEIWETSIVQDVFGSKGLDMNLVGEGPATIFRDGRRLDARWARATIFDAFRFYTYAGERVYLAPGQTWIHVVPHGWVIPSSESKRGSAAALLTVLARGSGAADVT